VALQIIEVPYDLAHRDWRMGCGPGHLIRRGAEQALRMAGHAVDHERLDLDGRSDFPIEIATAFELQRLISGRVQAALACHAAPIVLSGNCNTAAIGATAGIGASRGHEALGVVWFDAHADAETPDTTTSGFLDGMGLAMLTGHCWKAALATIPGFRPVPGERVVLVGARDISPAERELIQRSGITHVTVDEIRTHGPEAVLRPCVNRLVAGGVGELYLHLDLDVFDPDTVAPANPYAEPGGLAPHEVHAAIDTLAARCVIAATALTAFDPTCDADDRMLGAALNAMRVLARALDRNGTRG
jgi:arginase